MSGVYPIPPLAEIKGGPRNGHKVVSTFSGCGGACLGLVWAGFEIVWASEFMPKASETYRRNFPTTPVDERDIRKVDPQEILDQIGMEPGQLDLFEGSPPCSAFSKAGKRQKGWGEVKKYSDGKQRVDDLFFEYTRILSGLQPKAFVAENVTGLSTGVAKGYLKEIAQALKEAGPGYNVKVWKLDARFLGVSQRRPRLVFVGTRSDLSGPAPVAPSPQPEVPLKVALQGLEDLPTWIPESSFGRTMPSERHQPITTQFSSGQKALEIRPGKSHLERFNVARSSWEEPSFCVTQSAANLGAAAVFHPSGDRRFSVAELKRICGFPDDFELTGSYYDRVERLGRSVAPPMYHAVGQSLEVWLNAQDR